VTPCAPDADSEDDDDDEDDEDDELFKRAKLPVLFLAV
jgi:hypothetical protein